MYIADVQRLLRLYAGAVDIRIVMRAADRHAGDQTANVTHSDVHDV